MRPFDIRNINRTNSFEWSRCNNDAKAPFWRDWVCKTYGGNFSQTTIGKALIWEWKEPSEDEIVKWIFTDGEGNQHKVNNFKGFCTQHGLDDGCMYHTYTGKRKTHKGWKATRLYGVEGKKNPRDFGRNLPPPARS